ncbi:MAG TPA: PLP-dependent aminotransferase family protein [Terriglobales bacterium]|nr:PLP-dependent aminotransferase family protein [Terriglobales bacterium]
MFVRLQGTGPVSQRIYRGLRSAIVRGLLRPGSRLLSSRSLAQELAVSRKAVARAFERLADEGYITSRVGAGTFVSTTLPETILTFTPEPSPGFRPGKRMVPNFSAQAKRLLDQSPWPPPASRAFRAPLKYDFHYGTPALMDFPQTVWARLIAEQARKLSVTTLYYGSTTGYDPLRQAVADYIRRYRGVNAKDACVVIVNGSQQAMDILIRLFVNPGDRAVIEEPGYQCVRQALVAAGARVIPVPVDNAGLDTSRLPRLKGIRLAYVTPSHQFPLGGILPPERRLALLRWARETDAYVIEDDYDSEFRYDHPPVEAMQALDADGRVIYVGTFSKVLCPGMRIGYIVVPPCLLQPIASFKFLTDFSTPTFEQAVLAEFIKAGHFERHLRKLRLRNARRREVLVQALNQHLGVRAQIAGANAGVHVVVWLDDLSADDIPELCRRAAQVGVGVYPVTPYYLCRPQRAAIMLGYASLTENEIRKAVMLLREVLDEMVRQH